MNATLGTPDTLSVLVPIVERVDDLGALHGAFVPVVESLARPFEVIYLVSAEFDAALEQAVALQRSEPGRVRVLRFAQPVSEATALAAGYDQARGELVITVPSYFDADPKGLVDLVAAVERGADVATARRVERRSGALRRLQSTVFNRLVSWATGTRFRDLGSSARVVRRPVLEDVALYGEFHRFLPVMAERVGFRVEEIPVREDPRARPPRRYRLRTYFWRALDILSIFFLSHFTRRPLRLYGAIGTLFGVLGTGILAVVGVQRLMGHPLAGRPILVLGALLLGLGVQVFTVGLLGELLLFFHARDAGDYRIAAVYQSDPPPLPPREPK